MVVFGSTAGLTTVTLPARSPSGPVMRAGRPDADGGGFFHGNVGARDHLRNIDDRNQRRSAGGHFAGINGAVRDHAADGAANLAVGNLHGGAVVMRLGGGHLRLGAANGFALAHLIQRLQVPLGDVELALRLDQRDLRVVHQLLRERAFALQCHAVVVEFLGGVERLLRGLARRLRLWLRSSATVAPVKV